MFCLSTGWLLNISVWGLSAGGLGVNGEVSGCCVGGGLAGLVVRIRHSCLVNDVFGQGDVFTGHGVCVRLAYQFICGLASLVDAEAVKLGDHGFGEDDVCVGVVREGEGEAVRCALKLFCVALYVCVV